MEGDGVTGLTKRQRAGLCLSPTCPYLTVKAVPGRYLCEDCATRLEKRAAEIRERSAK